MRGLLILAAAAPLVLLGACQSKWEKDGHASGNTAPSTGTPTSRTYQAANFTQVDLRGADDVEVRIGNAFSVRADGDSEVLDKLDIRVDGKRLIVGRKDNEWGWGHNRRHAKVHVTLPRLEGASVGGSGTLNADRADGDFAGSVAGSGDLRVAALHGGRADLSVAGSGSLHIAGTATELEASVAGSGDIEAGGLTASKASVSIAGSGNVRSNVNGGADVSIIGSGDAVLGGGAKCNVSKLGSGEARCS
jgi:hypothetical protein